MKNLFLPYALALELKNLGFNEPCFGFYNNSENVPYLKQDFNDELKLIYKGDFDAPIFSQAFRFFREKYGLDGWVVPYFKLNDCKIYSYIIHNVDYDEEDCEINTYEEAELECLKKLIEIRKLCLQK